MSNEVVLSKVCQSELDVATPEELDEIRSLEKVIENIKCPDFGIRKQRFIDEYLFDMDVMGAARRAGMPSKSRKQLVAILNEPRCRLAVLYGTLSTRINMSISRPKIWEEVRSRAFANMSNYIDIDDGGEVKFNLAKTKRSDMAAIQSLDITAFEDADGNKTSKTKIRLVDGRPYLDMLVRVSGIDRPDPNEVKNSIVVVEYLDAPSKEVTDESED